MNIGTRHIWKQSYLGSKSSSYSWKFIKNIRSSSSGKS